MPRAPKKCGDRECQVRVVAVTYCPAHRVEADRRRGTTTERGYGADHQQARTVALAAMVEGQACARCGQPMYRGHSLQLDHTTDRSGYRGLTHTDCNLGAPRVSGLRSGTAATRLRPQGGHPSPAP